MNGKQSILGVSVSRPEAEEDMRDLVADAHARSRMS
jgi:hypothetical protein